MRIAQVKIEITKPTGNAGRDCAQLLKDLESLPFRVMTEAHQFIQSEVPVYTNTYHDAIKFESHFGPGSAEASVYLNRQTLLESAQRNKEPASVSEKYPEQTPEQYVDADIMVIEGEDSYVIVSVAEGESGRQHIGKSIYPQRIEREGSPIQHEGQALWERTAEFAGALLEVGLADLAAGSPGIVGR